MLLDVGLRAVELALSSHESGAALAVNMITAQYAKALDPIRVNAVDPGYTATNLNAHRGTQTVQEGSEIIVRMATIDRTGPTGTYVDRYGIIGW